MESNDLISNIEYRQYLKEMEESLVKLRLTEADARLKKQAEKENQKPVNGTIQKDGKYYLVRLEMEVEKLKSLIDNAEIDSRLSHISEEGSGKIRNAIGKAQLLISKKFKQFEELCCDNIENDPEKKETKPSDLQGYWEMMFIQIEDVNKLFQDIEQMKANDWRLPEPDTLDGPMNGTNGAITPKSKRKSPNKSPRIKNKNNNTIDDEKAKREAKSRLAAARKQAKLRLLEEAKNISPNNSLNSSLNSSFEILNNDDMTPERGVITPESSPAPKVVVEEIT